MTQCWGIFIASLIKSFSHHHQYDWLPQGFFFFSTFISTGGLTTSSCFCKRVLLWISRAQVFHWRTTCKTLKLVAQGHNNSQLYRDGFTSELKATRFLWLGPSLRPSGQLDFTSLDVSFKIHSKKVNKNIWPNIMTQLLVRINRPCCELTLQGSWDFKY